MIIRKPYAFLIKNFKLIHFFMLLMSSFILFKSFTTLNFFNEYVATRQFIESSTLIADTIPMWMTLLSLLLIGLATSIVVLFNKKDKPKLFYIITIGYYLVFIVICLISRDMIGTIMFDGLDPRISRIIRDTWLIAFILQIAIVGFYLIRTLGFDVKKFNFGEDLHELQISEEDSEEYEINTRFDADRVKMRAAMQREEFKAFFYENKLIIVTILVILLVVIPGIFTIRYIVANRKYAINEKIDLNNFNFSITEAYLTKKDSKGNVLFTGKNSYLIVKFSIENLEADERGINLNNLRLETNDKIYIPKSTYYEYFTDLGKGYNNQKISNEKKEYIAVYVVNDDDLVGDTIIRYADKITVKEKEATALYYRIIISPKNIDKSNDLIQSSLNKELEINTKELLGIKINVSHYNIKDKFTFDYKNKTKYIINSTGLVLSLNYKYENEKNKDLTFVKLLEKYATIRYTIGESLYIEKAKSITPATYTSNDVFLAVSENIKLANSIELVFNVRNIEYVYKIK